MYFGKAIFLFLLFLISHFGWMQNPITMEDVVIGLEKDWAYDLIGAAQKKRLENLAAVPFFQSQVYVKTNISITERKDSIFFMGMNISSQIPPKGIVYLSESLSLLNFRRKPKKIQEQMIASKSVGLQSLFSLNRAREGIFDFYENRLYAEAFSDRYFVSPLASDAFFYYHFKYLETLETENGTQIFRIQVLPKRKTDAVFDGEIFLEAQTFQLYKIALWIRKDSQLAYIDSLFLEQKYEKIDQIYFPIRQNAKGYLQAFEVKAIFQAQTVQSQIKIENGLATEKPQNLSFEVGSQALKSNAFWDSIRPFPLNEEEKWRYYYRELSEDYYKSPVYIAEKDKNFNRSFSQMVNNHYFYQNTRKKIQVGLEKLSDFLIYNPVEGYVIQPYFYLKNFHNPQQKNKNYQEYRLHLRSGLGIWDRWKSFGGEFAFTQFFRFFNDFYLHFSAGALQKPIHPQNASLEWLNSLYVLLHKDNQMPIFFEQYAKIALWKEWKVGLGSFFSLKKQFFRRIDDNFFSHHWIKNNKTLNAQNPFSQNENTQKRFFTLQTQLLYHPLLNYEKIGEEKIIQKSAFPAFSLNYQLGIGEKTKINYHFFEFKTTYTLPTTYLGDFYFSAALGGFIKHLALDPMDYKHFPASTFLYQGAQKNELFPGFSIKNKDIFYSFRPFVLSTDRFFTQFHFEHDLLGKLWDKIPGIRKIHLKWRYGAHFLYTHPQKWAIEYYLEFYNIAQIFSVGIFANYHQNNFSLPLVNFRIHWD